MRNGVCYLWTANGTSSFKMTCTGCGSNSADLLTCVTHLSHSQNGSTSSNTIEGFGKGLSIAPQHMLYNKDTIVWLWRRSTNEHLLVSKPMAALWLMSQLTTDRAMVLYIIQSNHLTHERSVKIPWYPIYAGELVHVHLNIFRSPSDSNVF